MIVHTLFCMVGISALLASSALAFNLIKFAGACYLIYLGVMMWRDDKAFDVSGQVLAQPIGAIYRQSVIMNVINPKVAIFFLAFLPQFVTPEAGPLYIQFAVLGGLFMAVAFIVMGIAGVAAGQIKSYVMQNDKTQGLVQYFAGGVLVALGIRLGFMETSG